MSRLLLSLKAKQIDLAILPFSSVRYESDYTISKQSLGFHYVGVLKKTSEDRYYDYSSFPKTTVVVADIGNETSSLVNNIKNNSIQCSITTLSGQDTVVRLINMVKLGRSIYGLADYNVLRHHLKNEPGMYLRPSSLTGFSSLNLIANNDNKGFLKKIDQSVEIWISRARNNGDFHRILKLHDVEDWSKYEQDRRATASMGSTL